MDHATHTLISACLGRKVSRRALRGEGLSLRTDSPSPGEAVFFHNTHDRDGDAARDDRFTRAGLVIRADDGAVTFVYIHRNRARLGRLSLQQPNRRRLEPGGPVINSYLRAVRPGDAPDMPTLAGQLLAGFAAL